MSTELKTLLDKAIAVGLIESDHDTLTIEHPDGERITFDAGESGMETYLQGLLKAWDLIRCGIVEVEQKEDEIAPADL